MLEHRKQEAIEGEDFETAKALKIRMDSLKDLIRSHDPENPFAQQIGEQYMAVESQNMEHMQSYQDDRPLPTLQNQSQDGNQELDYG